MNICLAEVRRAFLLVLPVLALACTGQPGRPLLVAAAANTRPALEEIVSACPQATEVELVFAASGRLAAQILNGAPFALFLSADTALPEKLFSLEHGLEPPRVYASGKLLLFTSRPAAGADFAGLLESTGSLALANPQQAPYGAAALQCLEYFGYRPDDFQPVYGASVAETAHFFLSGVDAALLPEAFLSDTRFMSHFPVPEAHWRRVPAAAYPPIRQALLLLREEGRSFYTYLLGAAAQLIWEKHGYTGGKRDG